MRAHLYTKNRLSTVIGVLALSNFGTYERRVMKQPLNVSSRTYKKIWYVCIRDRATHLERKVTCYSQSAEGIRGGNV